MTGRLAMAFAAGLGTAAFLALGVTATRWEAAEAVTNCSTSSASLDGEEMAALQAINAFRVQNGRAPLQVSPTLNTAAAWKSADSSNQPPLSHTDSLGRAPYTRAVDCGYPGGAAENIAWGYPTGSAVVQAWIGSQGHRNNLLGSYAVMGIGRTGNSWTLNLGLTVDSGSFPVSGGAPPPQGTTPPASTPVPATPAPGQGGGNQPPMGQQEPVEEQIEEPVSQPSNGIVPRTVLPAPDRPLWSLPANVPVKRATIQMVAFE